MFSEETEEKCWPAQLGVLCRWRLEMIPGVGHNSVFEDPLKWRGALLDFLDKPL
jgi:hypothetical protein